MTEVTPTTGSTAGTQVMPRVPGAPYVTLVHQWYSYEQGEHHLRPGLRMTGGIKDTWVWVGALAGQLAQIGTIGTN